MEHKGLRYNEGKLRYDLIHPFAQEQMAKVLTTGANKYKERNWENGMAWSNVISSLKRHLAEIEKGIDYDEESQELHAAHLLCNAHFLAAYYKIYPQGDDRPHQYLKQKRIGLDIDDVICSWVKEWCKLHNLPVAENWNFQYNIDNIFENMRENGSLDKFYSELPPLLNSQELEFEPVCYVSHRPVSKELTEEWLELHKFPLKPVFITKKREDKLQVCIDNKIDYFIDDNYETFCLLNNNKICCFLMNTEHNKRYNVGYKRIIDFNDFKNRFL